MCPPTCRAPASCRVGCAVAVDIGAASRKPAATHRAIAWVRRRDKTSVSLSGAEQECRANCPTHPELAPPSIGARGPKLSELARWSLCGFSGPARPRSRRHRGRRPGSVRSPIRRAAGVMGARVLRSAGSSMSDRTTSALQCPSSLPWVSGSSGATGTLEQTSRTRSEIRLRDLRLGRSLVTSREGTPSSAGASSPIGPAELEVPCVIIPRLSSRTAVTSSAPQSPSPRLRRSACPQLRRHLRRRRRATRLPSSVSSLPTLGLTRLSRTRHRRRCRQSSRRWPPLVVAISRG